ncbi:hypothetical protein ES705_04838 [subsurface metagenome]
MSKNNNVVIAIIKARMGSSKLPNKVLCKIKRKTLYSK